MSIKLPSIPGRAVVRALTKVGFIEVRGGKGSHIKLKRGSGLLIVPDHRPVKPGTMRSIIRSARLTVEQFIALL